MLIKLIKTIFFPYIRLKKQLVIMMILFYFINSLSACLLFANKESIENKELFLPSTFIQEGKTYIQGKVWGYIPSDNGRIRVAYPNPIMNKPEAIIVDISESGDFFLEVPMLSNATCFFVSDYYKEYIVLSLGDTCMINIDAKKIDKLGKFDAIKRVNISEQYVFFSGAFAEVNNDLSHFRLCSNNVNLFSNRTEDQTTEDYKTNILSTLEESLNNVKISDITEQTKELISIHFQQLAMRCLLFDRNLFKHLLDEEDLSESAVDIDYFSFLKELNINSSYSLYGYFFSNIISQCRQIEDLKKPLGDLINERKRPKKELVPDDIKIQKAYLSKVLNENNGLIFDLLEVQNYALEVQQNLPLNEWKINRLKKLNSSVYFNYITRENELLVRRLENINKDSNSIIFDVSKQQKVNCFDKILDLHKGKIILFNYWSEGCLGAIEAIKSMESLKEKYRNKKIVFIYLTTDRSLSQSWENKAVQIDGIHYRLNKDQLNYILSNYEIRNSTPSFLVFNKQGKCILKQTGYSEESMKNIFNKIDKNI